ncbi:uncharacterized protein LOC143019940 isoform X2 [Oratosquilla oratoria]|uniref:uncharacterized protein LOC143019940 isoform X2 n=1 Tax=Oratosquilla oratoria TaxID=337810 RepID=UPI003F770FFC
MKQVILFGCLLLISRAEGWDKNHNFYKCHTERDLTEQRMPSNLNNLIYLIEKWERTESYKSPYDIANALLKRYKHDGVVYRVDKNPHWGQWQTPEEKEKQEVNKRFVSLFETVPEDMYEPREECALYRALSHSVETHPFEGTDENWENVQRRKRRRRGIEIPPAKHPIENGVLRTPSGPIAAGTLLGGIMAMDQSGSKTIQSVFDSEEIEFMKDEMKRSSILPLHAFTIAGDIAQVSFLNKLFYLSHEGKFLGDRGIFGNCTACPRQYSLEQKTFTHMTQAEIFAGIDALLIAKAKPSFTPTLRLSQILRMYYSDLGLPGKPEYKACNRLELYKTVLDADKETLREQILHSMFAYTMIYNRSYIKKNSWMKVKETFEIIRDMGWNAFTSFVDNYDYYDFDQCEMFSEDVPCQSNIDLVMVYGHEEGVIKGKFQREFIAHMGQVLGVGEHRSRMGILDSKTKRWREQMNTFSNVADWGCNFTDTMTSGSSELGIMDVIYDLGDYYDFFYNGLRENPETALANAQVVLWYVGSDPDDRYGLKEVFKIFRDTYRDVYILMMGHNKGSYIDFLVDADKDFFNVSLYTGKPEKMAKEVAKRMCQVPSMFIYPSCKDPNGGESGHEYKSYLSPNRTTYMAINSYNFNTTNNLKLVFGNSSIRVCASQTDMNPIEGTDNTNCKDGPTDFDYYGLCKGNMSSCKNIYLSVTSLRAGYSCTDECEYPDQIVYTMKHEGMTCGSSALLPSILLLLAAVAFHSFRG